MTRDDLASVHEPFGDAFYYGPERLSSRFEDESTRLASGFQHSTYKTIFDRLEDEGAEGKRVFIKDILYYLLPPNRQQAEIAPSLASKKRGVGTSDQKANGVNGIDEAHGINGSAAAYHYGTFTEPGNPTVVPKELLEKFHFTFLIRDPHSSIPSFYRCTLPPLVEMTDWDEFRPSEAGYEELRRFFEYLRETGQIGPKIATGSKTNGEVNSNGVDIHASKGDAEICVIDADDLLDDPKGIMQSYCKSIGLNFTPDMLNWDAEEHHERAKHAFEKWKGWHEDAIDSRDLKPRLKKKAPKSEEEWDEEWKEKYGEEAAKLIRKTVDDNMDDYRYLKQFTIKAQ